MKEVLTKSFWNGVKKTFEDARDGKMPAPVLVEPVPPAPAEPTPPVSVESDSTVASKPETPAVPPVSNDQP